MPKSKLRNFADNSRDFFRAVKGKAKEKLSRKEADDVLQSLKKSLTEWKNEHVDLAIIASNDLDSSTFINMIFGIKDEKESGFIKGKVLKGVRTVDKISNPNEAGGCVTKAAFKSKRKIHSRLSPAKEDAACDEGHDIFTEKVTDAACPSDDVRDVEADDVNVEADDQKEEESDECVPICHESPINKNLRCWEMSVDGVTKSVTQSNDIDFDFDDYDYLIIIARKYETSADEASVISDQVQERKRQSVVVEFKNTVCDESVEIVETKRLRRTSLPETNTQTHEEGPAVDDIQVKLEDNSDDKGLCKHEDPDLPEVAAGIDSTDNSHTNDKLDAKLGIYQNNESTSEQECNDIKQDGDAEEEDVEGEDGENIGDDEEDGNLEDGNVELTGSQNNECHKKETKKQHGKVKEFLGKSLLVKPFQSKKKRKEINRDVQNIEQKDDGDIAESCEKIELTEETKDEKSTDDSKSTDAPPPPPFIPQTSYCLSDRLSAQLNDPQYQKLVTQILESLEPRKKQAFMFSITGIYNENWLEEKAKQMRKRSHKIAALSGLGGAVPVPGVSVAMDLGLMMEELMFYRKQFGLDPLALKELADANGVDVSVFQNALKDCAMLAANKDTVLTLAKKFAVQLAAEEITRFIPIIGSVVASGISFYTALKILALLIANFKMAALKVNEVLMSVQTGQETEKKLLKLRKINSV